MEETYLTLKQAAERCGVTYAALRRDVGAGRLPACRVGRKYFLSTAAVENYRTDLETRCIPSGYTIKQMMEILPLSYAFIIELIRSGRLPAVKCGRRYIIPRAAFEEFIRQAGEPR